MSLISSAFLIVIGVLSACIIKTQHVDDLEITIDISSSENNQKIIKKIHSRLGLRQTIARELSMVFGVEDNVIEVPRINQTTYGCKIRLFIAKTDTLQTLDDLREKVQDIQKQLSFIFRIKNANDLSIVFSATSSDMRENVMMSSVNIENVRELRQLSKGSSSDDESDEIAGLKPRPRPRGKKGRSR